MSTPCLVAIVEDDAAVCEAVAELLGSADDFRCAGAYGSTEQALPGLAAQPADMLVLDIHLPGMAGSEAASVFRERFPAMKIVMFTVFDDDQRIFASLCNGACGYILKKTPPAKLLDALRDARDGGAPMSPEIARRVVDAFRAMRPVPLAARSLTATEKKLLALIADGHSYLSAAAAMGITINTARNRVRSIYEKLQVHTRSEAVNKALRAHLI